MGTPGKLEPEAPMPSGGWWWLPACCEPSCWTGVEKGQRTACSQPPEGTRQRLHLWDLYQGWKQSTTEKQSEPAVQGGCCTTSQSSLALCVPYATFRQMAVVFPEMFQTFLQNPNSQNCNSFRRIH